MPRRSVLLAAMAAVVGLAAAAAVPSAAAPSRTAAPVSLDQLDSGVVQQVNAIRRQHGLAVVKLNQRLDEAASSHSDEMAARGYFDHSSADGTAFWKRIGRWYSGDGYAYWSVGENLLWSSPEVDAPKALRLWMASRPHRETILNPAWREVGICAVHVDRAPGVYGGRPATIVTMDFGVRH